MVCINQIVCDFVFKGRLESREIQCHLQICPIDIVLQDFGDFEPVEESYLHDISHRLILLLAVLPTEFVKILHIFFVHNDRKVLDVRVDVEDLVVLITNDALEQDVSGDGGLVDGCVEELEVVGQEHFGLVALLEVGVGKW